VVGELIAGRYELEELVGAGGMSAVYRAHDRLLERKVALKILDASYSADEETIERFRREARSVAQLVHPGIVTVIDRGADDGRQFIVFEYVDGLSLKEALDDAGRLPVRRALELAIETGRALSFAHGRGIVHRDVKPQNILLTPDGRAKVTDFGIARSLGVDSVTQSGTVLGTSSYIAPEQATGGEVGPATDVYALGVVLYELLAGEVPFTGDTFVAVAMRHVTEPVPPLLERRPDLPLRLVAAVERALAKDPAERYASMDDFVGELESCLDGLDVEPDRQPTLIVSRPPPPRERRPAPTRARSRRRRWPLVLLLLVLLPAAGGVAFLLLPGLPGSDGLPGQGPQPEAQPIELAGIRAFDPPETGGDGREHDDRAPGATDGDASTYWTTETYQDFAATKEGVGLVLDAGAPVRLERLVVVSETPGFTAEIRAGGSAEGPFPAVVSPSRTVGERTAFPVEGEPARFYLVWITALDGRARINGITATGHR
jgi:eukaryotic-like serine/threonine-protein kinase